MKFQVLFLCTITVLTYSINLENPKFTQCGSIAFRTDSLTMHIVTTQGDTLIFQDRIDPYNAEEYVCHILLSYLPVQNYWVMQNTYYESGGWQLINGENGRVYYLISEPITNPGGSRLVCAHADLVRDHNGIEVWRIDSDSLALEFQELSMLWGPINTEWKNDSTIIFEKSSYDENMETIARPGRLELSNDGTWVPDDTDDWN